MAKPKKLSEINHVNDERAQQLIGAAQDSVASLTGPAAGELMQLLIGQVRDLTRTVEAGKTTLSELIAADPLHRKQVALLDSIPGIGAWTAEVLSLEIGDFSRFHDIRALTAWCGMDPHEDRSGDGVIRRGISHRGNRHCRRALFMPAFTAIRFLPVVTALEKRLRAAGKPTLVIAVACMRKLLGIAFGIVRSNKPFNPAYEAQRRAQANVAQDTRSTAVPVVTVAPISVTLAAPISKAEAKRRRVKNVAARALPGCEVGPQIKDTDGTATAPR